MTLRSVVLSCASFLKPEDLVPAPQASAGMTKQAATDRNTGMDTPTSDGMPLRGDSSTWRCDQATSNPCAGPRGGQPKPKHAFCTKPTVLGRS